MPRFRLLLVVLLLPLLGTAALGHGEEAGGSGPLDRATRDFDQQHLAIRVVPDLAAELVDGEVRIDLASEIEGLAKVRLHCEDTTVLAVRGADGTPLAHDHADGVLTVELGETLAKGQETSLHVVYRARPTRGLYFHGPGEDHPDTPRFLYSQGQSNDNRRWIPCYDLPDDRFSWDLTVTVPEALTTVSNGTLTESRTADGLRTDHWVFEDRAPSYLISLIVGPLETITETWGDVTLEYSAVPGHADALRTSLRETPAMMAFFSEYTGQPYPWSRYAQTYVWDFIYGGMENITATTLNMRALHTEAARPNYMSEGLVAHELAHMWFGDLLTCETWNGIWLNEGFATYFTDLYFEHRDGHDAFLLRRRSQNGGYMSGTPDASKLNLQPHPRGDRPLELFGGKQYNRGAAILHMLRLEVGDDAFRRSVQEYVHRFRDGPVTSEDLRQVVERTAGRDLGWFWDQWVYGAGYPVLDVRRQGRRLVVRQTQTRSGGQGLFRFTLPVRLDAEGEVQRYRIFEGRHVFELPEQERQDYVRVGVGGDLLARIHVEQGFGAWARQLAVDPDVTGRLDAVEALKVHGTRAIAPLAGALADDASWAVREAAAKALGEHDTAPAAGQALLGATEDPDGRVREAVYEALGRRTRDEAGEAVVLGVRTESNEHVRAAAAVAVGRLAPSGAYPHLARLLDVDSHDDVVRQKALEGLRELGDPRAVELAIPYTAYRWGRGGTHRLRTAAIDLLLALAPDERETHGVLVGLLDDPFHRIRQKAADACGTYHVPAALPALRRLEQHDPFGGVRNAARQARERIEKGDD